MIRKTYWLTLIALAACTNSDDSGGSQFEGECDGSAATCGQISVRWSVALVSRATATCADAGASSVRVTATFQADGRVGTYTTPCASAATLTPRLPIGPYALSVELVDAADAVLDRETTNATIGVAGTVTEATVQFEVLEGGRPGTVFGSCSPSQSCTDGSSCRTFGGVSMCLNECTTQTACKEDAAKVGETFYFGCGFSETPNGGSACFVQCAGANAVCPGDLVCRDLGNHVYWVCTP
jgi:hypothetical protein